MALCEIWKMKTALDAGNNWELASRYLQFPGAPENANSPDALSVGQSDACA
jgi:hypothetical protein